jgi:hypothetical protein
MQVYERKKEEFKYTVSPLTNLMPGMGYRVSQLRFNGHIISIIILPADWIHQVN